MTNDDNTDPRETHLEDVRSLATDGGWWSEVYRRRAIVIRIGFVLGLLLVLARTIIPPSLWAQGQGPNRAGLVILHGDGRMTTACVRFQEQSISGLDLLDRSGIGYIVQYSTTGAAVCKIEDEGCDYPTADCFCHCKGAACAYWNYYHLQDGKWNYASLGASASRIMPGQVDGWVWGSRSTQPPQITLDQICTVGAAGPSTATPLSPRVGVSPTSRSSASDAGVAATSGSAAPRAPTSSLAGPGPGVAATELSRGEPPATTTPASKSTGRLLTQSRSTATPLNAIPPSASVDEGTDGAAPVDTPLATPVGAGGTLATGEPAGGTVATPIEPQGQTATPTNYLVFGVLALVLVGGIVGIMARKK